MYFNVLHNKLKLLYNIANSQTYGYLNVLNGVYMFICSCLATLLANHFSNIEYKHNGNVLYFWK